MFLAPFQVCFFFIIIIIEMNLNVLHSLPFSYVKLLASVAAGLIRIPLSMEGVSPQLESLLIELSLVFGQPSKEM